MLTPMNVLLIFFLQQLMGACKQGLLDKKKLKSNIPSMSKMGNGTSHLDIQSYSDFLNVVL